MDFVFKCQGNNEQLFINLLREKESFIGRKFGSVDWIQYEVFN